MLSQFKYKSCVGSSFYENQGLNTNLVSVRGSAFNVSLCIFNMFKYKSCVGSRAKIAANKWDGTMFKYESCVGSSYVRVI